MKPSNLMREPGKYLNIAKNRYQKFMAIDVNEALKALANPMRLAILNWLKDPRTAFPEQEVDPETVGVCVSIIQARTGLSQSTTSLYLAALQRAQLVTSQRIGPWTYYKRHDENIDAFFKALQERI
ncbi:ArsR/SmtB family transcription factor [Aeromonas simiae]|nr:helix-turn-helix transcriptional regulator [Aeromonas simiae]